MNKARLKVSFLTLFALWILPLLLNATPLLRNDLLKIEAVKIIDDIGQELYETTGIHTYVIATNEHFPEGFNLVEDSKKYEAKLNKPYVLFIFAPYATIIQKAKVRGRVGIIPSSKQVRTLYDYEEVRDAGINIVAVKDSNTDEDKFNIAVLQSYSVLAENIALSKGVTLTKIIPDEMGTMVMILRILIYSGTAVLLWIFIFRPIWMRRKNGNKQ